MKKNIHDLIDPAMQYLKANQYSGGTQENYCRIWKRFAQYCEASGHLFPDFGDVAGYLDYEGVASDDSRNWQRFKKRAIMCLFDLDQKGEFPRQYSREKIIMPTRFIEVRERYTAWLAPRGLNPKTINGKRIFAKKFLQFLDESDIEELGSLNSNHVYAYLSCFEGCTSMAKSAHLFFLREFLKFLVEEYSLDPMLATLFPVILVNRNDVIPSTYGREELKRVLETLDRDSSNSRRDRAIILLAMQLGIRVGDIRRLKRDQIDWRLHRIVFEQQKTGRQVNLPLLDECMYAILDYLKNERPQSYDPHIFLRSRAPYKPYAEAEAFHRVIDMCYKRAGVDTSAKHRGMHSVRHSVALNMLLSGTPYPVITGVLGHESTNTTKVYLRADVEHLRQISLEVPYVCEADCD